MDTYLLLRSNRQSGPYTLQQLVSFGLKPYDLIWVEGKSAAWRYPGEIDTLKAFSPSTEEQPFDRFFKKTEEKNPKIIHEESSSNSDVEPQPVASKKVFVSLPENTTAKKPVKKYISTASNPAMKTKPIDKEEKIETKPVYITEETNEPIIKENKAAKEPELNEKYSESLEDIKRRYTETYLKRKKRSVWTSTHTSIAQVFGGAIFFCVLVVIVYRNFSGDESTQLSRTTIIQPNKKDINNKLPETATTNPATVPTATDKETITPKQKQEELPQEKIDSSLMVAKPVTVPVLEKSVTTVNEKDFAVMTSKPEPKTEMPNKEEEKESKPKTRPVNIRKLVNVSANNYKQQAFGGVKNLELTVNNNSKFALDRVVVELQYLKPSEQPVKTETIVFNTVQSGDSKTLKIPDYTRGVKIAYKILEIESSQYDTQTAGL